MLPKALQRSDEMEIEFLFEMKKNKLTGSGILETCAIGRPALEYGLPTIIVRGSMPVPCRLWDCLEPMLVQVEFLYRPRSSDLPV